MAAIGGPTRTCANCGGPGDRLAEVLRVYVALDDVGRMTGSETTGGPEWWCLSCRSLYPHQPVGSDQGTRDPPAAGPGA